MKYQNIATALGWAETPDTEEGIFLQPEEAAAIDAALVTDGEDKTAEKLEEANAKVTELTAQLNDSNDKLAKKKAKHDAAKLRIAQLEAENKELGGQSSGSGTTLPTTEDETADKNKSGKVSLNNPEHPLNKDATRRLNAKAKK